MRKFLGIAAIVFALFVPAGAALAQDSTARDPFVPLIQPQPVPTTDTGVPTDPTVPVDPAPDPTDPLPSTGSSTTTWLGLGYVLIALGTGSVVLSRVYAPLRPVAR